MSKHMFSFGLLACSLFFSAAVQAQVLKTLGDKAKAKIGQRANNKVDNAMDKGLDELEAGAKDKKPASVPGAQGEGAGAATAAKTTFSSKFDFVPGEKVLAFEDFSHAAVGDFPTRWNTNATSEVVTLSNREGKWLKINKEGVWLPEFISKLPENFTLEFDLGVSENFDGSPFVLNMGNVKSRDKEYTDYSHYVNWRHGHGMHLWFIPYNFRASARARLMTSTDGNSLVDNATDFKGWDHAANNFAHISLWRQKERLRVYVNGEKIYDVPKAFPEGTTYNMINFAMQGSFKPELYHYFLGNLRLAAGAPDTRNKLVTEGKFVTRGILFDVNRDVIRPESYGALKDIANVLKENPSLKVQIVGHTDADGDDAKNLDLSKRRAASVKAFLVKEFGIDGALLQTDGKGESAPVEANTTAEGKANNRRVEFIRQPS